MKTEYVGAFTVEREKDPEPTEVRVPLKKPLPLIACCCAKTPCVCAYGKVAKEGPEWWLAPTSRFVDFNALLKAQLGPGYCKGPGCGCKSPYDFHPFTARKPRGPRR